METASCKEIFPESKSKSQLLLETLAVAAFFFCAFVLGVVGIFVLLYWCLVSRTGCLVTLLYCTYIYLDRHTNESGGHRFNWYRNLAWWKYFVKYFPIHLHKTADLPPDSNYLLAIFPHGIYPVGAFSAFGTDVLHFRQLYPGLTSYLCTLRILFFLPLMRDLMRMCGLTSCTERSVNWILGSGSGKVCVLVPGGAKEALYSHPGVYKTVLNNRKGFTRIAIKNGASLVPVVAFGEVDVYTIKHMVAENSLEDFRKWVRGKLGFIPMRFVGEGFLGVLPRRVPIHMVVGSPMKVTRIAEPTEQQVDMVHHQFVSNLLHLFETEKHKYLKDPKTQLQFV